MRAQARILIADDNPRSRELLRTVLEQDGYEVLEFANGDDALLGAHQYLPDLILLDIRMPGRSGFEVASVLRSLPALARSPIVALTASAMQGDRERILSSGFDEYLPKPIHLPELRRLVTKLISPTTSREPT